MVQILNPQLYSNNNKYLKGGKIYSYLAGTSTLTDTYQTVEDAKNRTSPNTNPVILDSTGRAKIVLNGATKLVLKDEDDNTIWTVDDLDSSSLNIVDGNGNEILVFNADTNAVNNFEMSNAITGENPLLAAKGYNANINIQLKCKGTGNVSMSKGLSLGSGNLTISAGNVTLSSGSVNISVGDLTVNNLEGIDINSVPLVATGTIAHFAGSSTPSGYLQCDGSAVSRTTYANLFSVIGTTFGAGDGSTTFNLPNQARRTIVGKGGSGTATLGNTIGSTGGAETHTLTSSEMPAHTHPYSQRANLQQIGGTGIWDTRRPLSFDANDEYASFNSGSTGGGTAHNIMQPSLVLMMVIRV